MSTIDIKKLALITRGKDHSGSERSLGGIAQRVESRSVEAQLGVRFPKVHRKRT